MEQRKLPTPVTATEEYLSRIVEQNDEIISLLREPGTSGQICPEVPLQEPKRRKR